MDGGLLALTLAACFGLFMAWGIGANDVANAMATSVGSKALTLRQAVIIAAIFEFSGAFLAGGEVTSTIRGGMLDPMAFQHDPAALATGMLSALLAAGLWLLIATHYGLPVSTTHSIVGAIVGFGAVGVGMEAVRWGKVGTIALSWITSPLLASVIAFLLVRSVQRLVFGVADPLANARRVLPVYVAFTAAIIALITLRKGLSHLSISPSWPASLAIAALCAGAAALLSLAILGRLTGAAHEAHEQQIARVERAFAGLMIISASAMAFAHGSNDVANAVGPVATIVGLVGGAGLAQATPVPVWVLLLGAGGIVAGLLTYGHRVIATVGSRITALTPSRGFCCELATATTVVIASGTGLPVSTTQTLVGAVLGAGFARGISALNMRVIVSIFMSWVVTLPAGALLAALFFAVLSGHIRL